MNAMATALSPTVSPAPAPQPARLDNARGSDFARCLDQAREGDKGERSDEANTADITEPSNAPPRPAAKTRSGREATASRKPQASTVNDVPPQNTTHTDAATDPQAAATETPCEQTAAASDLAALLPGWSPLVIAAAKTAVSADATGGVDALQAASATAGALPASTSPNDAIAARAEMVFHADATEATAGSPSLQPANAGEQKDALSASAVASTSLPTPLAFAAAPTTPAAALARAAEPALPTATLSSPIDAPNFAPSLATQVRWWANDGVQQAQLLLHPAEMGPVAVKIVLDGRDARIDFSADLAATRGAIEAALPVLAAALDESGLKLSGGGVHDGSAQRQPQWSARGVTHRTTAAADVAPRDGEHAGHAVRARSSAGRGMVDLVA
jgi:flagellar hook-length control protein FliK